MNSYSMLALRLHVNLNPAKHPMPLYQPPPQGANYTTNNVVSLHAKSLDREVICVDVLRSSLMTHFLAWPSTWHPLKRSQLETCLEDIPASPTASNEELELKNPSFGQPL